MVSIEPRCKVYTSRFNHEELLVEGMRLSDLQRLAEELDEFISYKSFERHLKRHLSEKDSRKRDKKLRKKPKWKLVFRKLGEIFEILAQ